MYRKLINKISCKGFLFSLEATISIMLFLLMITTLPQVQNSSLKELLILQQENDLLRVWSAKETNTTEMLKDVELMFGKNAEVWINETQLTKSTLLKNSIASEGIILDNNLKENKIKIIVNYD